MLYTEIEWKHEQLKKKDFITKIIYICESPREKGIFQGVDVEFQVRLKLKFVVNETKNTYVTFSRKWNTLKDDNVKNQGHL